MEKSVEKYIYKANKKFNFLKNSYNRDESKKGLFEDYSDGISRLNDEELKTADNILMNLAEQNEKEWN